MNNPRLGFRRSKGAQPTTGGETGGIEGSSAQDPKRKGRRSQAGPELASIIDAIPAAILLLRDQTMIQEVAGRYASVFGRPEADLVGRDLLRYVAAGDSNLVGSIIAEARSAHVGSVPSSVIARFEQPDGSRRLVEVSVAHRADTGGSSGGSTIAILRPQSVRHGLNSVLVPHVGWQDSDELYAVPQLASDSLVTISNVLGCEPVAHECYFLAAEREGEDLVKHTPIVDTPPPDTPGPWNAVISGDVLSSDTEVSQLIPELQRYAERKRFTTVRCFAVLAANRHRVAACLVAWDRREGPISPATEATFRYATEIASLAIARAHVTAAEAEPVERARRAAQNDIVTGLGLEPELVRALDEKIEAGDRPGVVYVRLSALPALKQRLGSFTADTVIRVAALRVNSIIRQTDEIFRYGSDGIAVVCTGVDEDRLADIAGRVRTKLGAPFRVDAEAAVHVGAIVGTGLAGEGAAAGQELLESVVTALNTSLQAASH